MQKQSAKTAAEINQQLYASEKASGAETAKVEDIPDQPTFDDPKYQQNRNKQNQIRQDYQRITTVSYTHLTLPTNREV